MGKDSFYSIKFLVPFTVGLMFIATVMVIATSLFLLSKQENDAVSVNLAGRQRMLTQKMTKEALAFQALHDQKALLSLSETAKLFDKSLKALKSGDPAMGLENPPSDEKIEREWKRLRDLWNPFYEHVRGFSTGNRGTSKSEEHLRYLLEHNLEILAQANALTKAFEENAKSKIRLFKIFLYIMFFGGIFTLVVVSIGTKKILIDTIYSMLDAIMATAGGRFDIVLEPKGPKEMKELATAFNCLATSMTGHFAAIGSQNEILGEAKEFITVSNDKIREHGEISDHIAQEVNDAATRSASDLETVSSAVRDLTIATNEIAQSVATTASKANEAQEHAQSASKAIERLEHSSNEIGNIIKVINNIASQTNLLALNATIEAARAGEAGKGFAVVANEVKELAKQTADATEQIKGMIETIQADTSTAVEAVESITASVMEVNDLSTTIASATEEQTATVSEISTSIERAAAASAEVQENVLRLSQHTTEFASLASDLYAIDKSMSAIQTEAALLMAQVAVDENMMARMTSHLPPAFRVKSILFQHLKWRDTVIKGILKGVPPEVETDPHKCGLDRFLDSYSPESPAAREIISKLTPVHAQLHTSVVAVKDHIMRGASKEQTIMEFENTVEPLFNKVVEYLSQWIAIEEGKVQSRAATASVSSHTTATTSRPKVFMEWGPKLETGIKTIDDQHKKLVNMVNTLYAAISSGTGKDHLGRLLDELIDYTVYHFGTEEELFKKYEYPEAAGHKKIHEELAAKVMDFRDRFQKGEALLSYDLMNFLKNWLVNHIGVTDKKYAPFLKSKGVN